MRLTAVFSLDVFLLLSLCALEHVPFTGMILHEWLGLALAALIVLHLLLSWSWIAASIKRVFSDRQARTGVNFLLNICLFGATVAVICSGILISQQAVPALASADVRWERLHDRMADLVVVLAGLHLAINWDWLLAAIRRLAFR